jgi:crossover junction endodeoxyribonuclease RuvC
MLSVLGIDPGLASTGFGLLHKEGESISVISYGVIKTPSTDKVPDRLLKIYSRLKDIFDNNNVDHVALEKIFFNSNLKTVVNVSEARGIAMLVTSEYNKPLFEYTPLEAKKALLGVGRATKREVQFAVQKILNMDKKPTPDDAADGIALALCHIYNLPYLRVNTL